MATINGTFNSLIAGTLSGTIGTPGPQGQTGPQGPAGPTFTGGPITSPITFDAGTNSTAFENGDVFAQDNTSGSYGAIYTGGLQASNGALTIDITGAGITFGDSTVQSTAFPGSAAFYPATGNPSGFLTASALTPYLLSSTAASTYQTLSGMSSYLTKAGNLSGLANTATARTNLGLGTMATATAADYSTTTVANGLYYPLSGNPSAFLTASALTGYATESFVTSQGYIGDAPSDGSQYARQDGAWEVVTGGGSGSYLPLAGGTMTGAIVFDGTSGQYISKGNFDTSRGGNYGISLVCSIGYEFNWQAGWLTTTNQGSVTPRPLYLDSLAGTTLRSWNSETDTGTEVAHTGINVGNTSPYYVNVAPDILKVFESTNELGVTIAHDSVTIQHIDTPDQTSYFTNEYIGFEDMSGTPHSAWIEHDVITVQDATDTTQMRSTGISLSAGGSITFGDATVQTTAYTGGGGGGTWGSITGTLSDQTDLQGALDAKYDASNPSGFIADAPSDSSLYARQNGSWASFTAGQGPQGDPGPQGPQGDPGPSGGPLTSAITFGDSESGDYYETFFNNDSIISQRYYGSATQKTTITPTQVEVYNANSGSPISLTVAYDGITFPDSTVQTTAPVSMPPSDGNYYVFRNGAWVQCTVVSIYDSNTNVSYNCLTV
jgi:hypothetical protein